MRLAASAVLALLSLSVSADPPAAATIDGWITDLADEYVKDRRCGTCNQNRVPYDVVAIEHPALAKRIPDIRFFALDWICCQDRPEATHMLAVGKTVDVRFEIGGSNRTWAADIAPLIPPVKTAEEARETASLLITVTTQPERFDAKVIVDASLGKTESTEDGFSVAITNAGGWSVKWAVTFDKEGKLKGIEAARR